MKEKVKSLVITTGYLAMAFVIQALVTIIYTFISVLLKLNKESMIIYRSVEYVNYIGVKAEKILIISSIITVLVLWIIYKRERINVIGELGLNDFKLINGYASIVLGVSAWAINYGLVNILSEIMVFKKYFYEFNTATSTVANPNTNIFITILSIVIIVPFAEEFLFRGIIQNTLTKGFSIKSSIIIQASVFGIFHGNVIQGVYTVLLGLLLGYVAYKTRSIWSSVIIHIMNNLVSLYLSNIVYEGYKSMEIYIPITGILAGIISLLIIKGYNQQKDIYCSE
ncbi:CAAX prenyl protease-related protein [uncultured Clostridium sp.]|uniref:CPBP family intramembrane glutamic endopeptidase n=1 Tax=uncultured Clostridium sp. TaxID=59620 RepID=UPI0008203BF9|nr:type II CAAX endopeptidase family protein [uncultured Clostridium sp.]SCJ98896.1 CAAX prenyl protease-related protein [uncultured Clostridium sp.]